MSNLKKKTLALILVLSAAAAGVLILRDVQARKPITFFVTADLHYGVSPTVADANLRTVEAMNALPGTPYPSKIGGVVDPPRGVVVIGDLIEDGSREDGAEMWGAFVRDYGAAGEGRLRFPVYEGAGNHDGGVGDAVRRGIVERNKIRPGISRISPNGLHYSWDWGRVRFLQLNLFAGSSGDDIINPWGKKFIGDWKLPEHSLEFLESDLREPSVGRRRPIVIFQHYGWDKWGLGWWSEEERQALSSAIRDHNVAAVFWGHSHAVQRIDVNGIPTFCVGSGQADPDPGVFMVVRITPREMIVAERNPDGWGFVDRVALVRK